MKEQKRLIGILRLTRGGYGFVEPDEPGRDHIYVPQEGLGGALPGDRVEVILQRTHDPLRPVGKVVAIKERGQCRLVAYLLADGRARPEDDRNPYVFEVEKSPPMARPGMKVLLEIARFPSEGGKPAGRIVEVLGPAGEPDTETAAILANYDVPLAFPPEVKREARALARGCAASDQEQRLDLRHLLTFTIDPDDARDYDDALSCEEQADGSVLVGVHIADVSSYVRPGTDLDAEARRRGTSIYLPERVIPMLPEEISNDLCSLRPNEDRLVKTVFLRYNAAGQRLGYSIHRSIIRSRKRFTYRQVKALLAAERRPRGGEAALLAPLQRLHGLAQCLRQQRLARGSVELDLPEFKIILDEDGRAIGLERCAHDFSHQLVEE
ncbi:MAG: ribonuclease R, partial [Planctomycetota bacterium]|nr:ribonuclease R [Planctomycetota bacterium]